MQPLIMYQHPWMKFDNRGTIKNQVWGDQNIDGDMTFN